jgi:hypothetical protein
MPISAPYTWRQSATTVWIDITVRGGSNSVLDTLGALVADILVFARARLGGRSGERIARAT